MNLEQFLVIKQAAFVEKSVPLDGTIFDMLTANGYKPKDTWKDGGAGLNKVTGMVTEDSFKKLKDFDKIRKPEVARKPMTIYRNDSGDIVRRALGGPIGKGVGIAVGGLGGGLGGYYGGDYASKQLGYKDGDTDFDHYADLGLRTGGATLGALLGINLGGGIGRYVGNKIDPQSGTKGSYVPIYLGDKF